MPGRIDTVKSGAVIFFRSSSTITSLAICRRLAAQSCKRSSRSCISAMRTLSPLARASSASAARTIAAIISCRSVRPSTVSARVCSSICGSSARIRSRITVVYSGKLQTHGTTSLLEPILQAYSKSAFQSMFNT